MILGPTGLFAATDWGIKAQNNPAAHGFSEVLYEFSSASANNGSGFEGLADTYGFAADDNEAKAPQRAWDIACGLVMLISRFIPIIAPLAIAGSLAAKKPTPFTVGTHADRHGHVRLRPAGHDPPGRGAALPAGGGAGPGGRALWADSVRRVDDRTCESSEPTSSSDIREDFHVTSNPQSSTAASKVRRPKN